MVDTTDKDKPVARSILVVNFFLPLLNGLMHVVPAIGTSWMTLGSQSLEGAPCLALLFALHVLIDGARPFTFSSFSF